MLVFESMNLCRILQTKKTREDDGFQTDTEAENVTM